MLSPVRNLSASSVSIGLGSSKLWVPLLVRRKGAPKIQSKLSSLTALKFRLRKPRKKLLNLVTK